jgi:glycosyltransferase involved in cell wall biosynthesis
VDDDLKNLPTIALVTPTYNHARVLEDAMRSVLDQSYPKLQYVVVDGGSDDGTAELLDKYRDRLHAAISEPDLGPHDAVNKGFALTTGTVMGWLNADDTLLPGSLLLVGTLFRDFPDVRWLTGTHFAIDPLGRPAVVSSPRRWTRWHLLSPHAKVWIAQESTFWRRDLWEQAGGTTGDIWGHEGERAFPHAFDFELWGRFSRYAKLHTVAAPIGCYRYLEGQQGVARLDRYEHYAAAVRERERPRTAHERALAAVVAFSLQLRRVRLHALEDLVAGALGAPPLISFDASSGTFRRSSRD